MISTKQVNMYNPLSKDRINILKEGFKKYVNPKFKYVEILY